MTAGGETKEHFAAPPSPLGVSVHAFQKAAMRRWGVDDFHETAGQSHQTEVGMFPDSARLGLFTAAVT